MGIFNTLQIPFWRVDVDYQENDLVIKDGVDKALLVAFWDKKSKGTKSMIELATKKGMLVKVVKY